MAWDSPIEWVGQKLSYDCGIACVAMVAGVPYHQAFDAVFARHRQRHGLGYASSRELATGLRRLGVVCHLSERFRSTEKRHRVILGFDWRTVNGQEGHFVVWCPVTQRFRDPGFERPWALRNDIYLRGFRRAVRNGHYSAVVAEGLTARHAPAADLTLVGPYALPPMWPTSAGAQAQIASSLSYAWSRAS